MIERLEELIAAQVKITPGANAVVSETGSITYLQLDLESTRLANALLQRGLMPGSRVCFILPKSAEAVISIIAILKAGCTYVPLDPMNPATRLAQTINKLQPAWLISGFKLEPLITEIYKTGITVIMPKICWVKGSANDLAQYDLLTIEEIDKADAHQLRAVINPAQVAYIIFTSGTVGQPKGVTITHKNVINYLNWTNNQFPVSANDKVASHAPFHFDVSVWDIFDTLKSGAELHLVNTRQSVLPQVLANFIRNMAITQWKSVPSILIYMLSQNVIMQNDFPALKRVIWGGEALPIIFLRRLMLLLPHVEFTNSYGPAEATIGCLYYTVKQIPATTDTAIPIGIPLTGNAVTLLDKDKQKIAEGETGEIYIAGAGLSPGYWNDDELNRKAFIQIPAGSGQIWFRTGDLARIDNKGLFYFCGRVDRQIKARGYRIELDEIEAALNAISGLTEGAIVTIPTGDMEGNKICAAYACNTHKKLAPSEIKAILALSLPQYMLPRVFIQLNELPKGTNGKMDHHKLQQMFANKITNND